MKKMRISRKTIKAMSCTLVAAIALTGCGGSKNVSNEPSDEKFVFESYPIQTEETLSIWSSLPRANSVVAEYAETDFAKLREEMTGVKATYRQAPVGQEKEAFNILIASGELPDIIEYSWGSYEGGIDKAIDEGVIIGLDDILPESAPNLYNYLQNDPEADRFCKSYNGQYYAFPHIREANTSYRGPMVRKDWLDELGLPIPETIDDWYVMLKAFKEKKGATTPLTLPIQLINQGAFLGAYGVKIDFYIDEDHNVKYGPIEPGFKEGLMTLNKWYEEGLLDKNFATLNPQEWDANMLTGKSGATIGNGGGHLGKWMTAMETENPDFYLYGVQYPTLNKGEIPKFGHMEYKVNFGIASAITTDCKNPHLAARYLDFGYTDEGSTMFNYGREGVSYVSENGALKFTDKIHSNENGWSVNNALSYYSQGDMGGSFFAKNTAALMPVDPNERDTNIEIWANTDEMKYRYPSVSLNNEAASEFSNIMGDLNTYVSENVIQFIIGLKPISEYDSFVEQIKKMGIDRAIELKQEAANVYYN